MYLLALTLFNILASLAFFVEINSSIYSEVEEKSFIELKLNAVHLPIIINGDGDFNTPNGVSPGGDGSYGNPYIIENLIINTAIEDDCILINNTQKYFKIKNCVLMNSGSGMDKTAIKFENVSNGCIWNNDISLAGIFFLDSHDNSISNNTIHTNSSIFLNLSNNNTIFNNSITQSKEIHLLFSDGNDILNNYMKDNKIGIKLQFSLNNTIKANEIYDCEEYGIGVWSGSNNTRIIENYIYNNGIEEIDIDADAFNCFLEDNIFGYREENGGELPPPKPDLFWLFLIIIIGSVGAVAVGFLYRRHLRQKEYKHPEPAKQEPHHPEGSSKSVDLPEPPES